MDWEQVNRIRAANQAERERLKAMEQAAEEKIKQAMASPGFRDAKAPDLDRNERLIFRLKTQLIDYIIEHGLVQGFIFDGVVMPIVGGNIVITGEMIGDAARKEGLTDGSDVEKIIEYFVSENGVVMDENYVHTDNNFTDALLNKLNGIEAGAEENKVIDVLFNGTTVLDPDTRTAAIVITPEDIKAWYEQNKDTNAFTDAEKAKLEGIEAGAEVNKVNNVFVDGNSVVNPEKNAIITKELIKAAYESNENTNAFTDDEKANLKFLWTWYPEIDHEIEEIKTKHDADIRGAYDTIDVLSSTLTTRINEEHEHINSVQEKLNEQIQKEAEDVTTINARISSLQLSVDSDVTTINAKISSLQLTVEDDDRELRGLIRAEADLRESGDMENLASIRAESNARAMNDQSLQSGISVLASAITMLNASSIQRDQELEVKIDTIQEALGKTDDSVGQNRLDVLDLMTKYQNIDNREYTHYTTLSSQLASLNERESTHYATISSQLMEITSEQGELMADITSMKEDITSNSAEIAHVQTELDGVITNVSSMTLCCSSVKAQIDGLRADVDSNTEMITTNQDDIAAINRTIGELERQGLRELWRNSSPMEAFSAKDVTLPPDYDGDYVTIVLASTGRCQVISLLKGLAQDGVIQVTQAYNDKIWLSIGYRYFKYETGKVIVGNAFVVGRIGDTSQTLDNTEAIPLVIYGGVGSPVGGGAPVVGGARNNWENSTTPGRIIKKNFWTNPHPENKVTTLDVPKESIEDFDMNNIYVLGFSFSTKDTGSIITAVVSGKGNTLVRVPNNDGDSHAYMSRYVYLNERGISIGIGQKGNENEHIQDDSILIPLIIGKLTIS